MDIPQHKHLSHNLKNLNASRMFWLRSKFLFSETGLRLTATSSDCRPANKNLFTRLLCSLICLAMHREKDSSKERRSPEARIIKITR